LRSGGQPAHPEGPCRLKGPEVSVVIPLKDEDDNIDPLVAELVPVLEATAVPFEGDPRGRRAAPTGPSPDSPRTRRATAACG
jgi:hypothetical protein